ncbi:MAG: flagellar basal body-associated FliL family protein [Pseudomonadota bacterium]
MADVVAEDIEDPPEKKGGKAGLLIGLLAAIALGAGGFFVTYSGLLGGSEPDPDAPPAREVIPLEEIAFLKLDPVRVSLGRNARARHLEMTAELEVAPAHEADVIILKPRILDVVNTYLRAVEVRDLEDPGALPRIRAQLLRRIQIVTGQGRVRDLLITEFVLN